MNEHSDPDKMSKAGEWRFTLSSLFTVTSAVCILSAFVPYYGIAPYLVASVVCGAVLVSATNLRRSDSLLRAVASGVAGCALGTFLCVGLCLAFSPISSWASGGSLSSPLGSDVVAALLIGIGFGIPALVYGGALGFVAWLIVRLQSR